MNGYVYGSGTQAVVETGRSEHYSYLWHVCVCVCVCACVRACVRARSCRCEYVRLGVVLLVQMGC